MSNLESIKQTHIRYYRRRIEAILDELRTIEKMEIHATRRLNEAIVELHKLESESTKQP